MNPTRPPVVAPRGRPPGAAPPGSALQRQAWALPLWLVTLAVLLALGAAAAGVWTVGKALGGWGAATSSPTSPLMAPSVSPSDPAQPARGEALAAAARALNLSEWLAGHSRGWRVARLKEYPEVLVIEFPDLREQGAAMNRIAAFLQKAGAPRDRVLDDAELANFIARSGDNPQTFYLGHDYDDAGLQRFYAQAQAQGLALNAQETRVRTELLAAGMFAADAARPPEPAPRALITFSATQPDDSRTPGDESVDAQRREAVLRHEVSHGRFYTRAAYREHCLHFWHQVLSESQRRDIRRFLASLGYNPDDELLMVNEAQAFMMNTPDERAFAAQDIGMTPDELGALRLRFWRTLPVEASGPPQAPAAFASRPAGLPQPATGR